MVARLREWWSCRQAPARLKALQPVTSVLVLCTANRVRSPFAEHLLRRRMTPGVVLFSRGLLEGGLPCPPESIETASTHGIDLSGHVARQLTPTDLLTAGIVLVMDRHMGHVLASRFPAVRHRLFPLGWFDPERGWGTDIEDPFALTREDYAHSYARIERCCDEVSRLVDTSSRRPSS